MVTDRWMDGQTEWQTTYYNPSCARMPRVNENKICGTVVVSLTICTSNGIKGTIQRSRGIVRALISSASEIRIQIMATWLRAIWLVTSNHTCAVVSKTCPLSWKVLMKSIKSCQKPSYTGENSVSVRRHLLTSDYDEYPGRTISSSIDTWLFIHALAGNCNN